MINLGCAKSSDDETDINKIHNDPSVMPLFRVTYVCVYSYLLPIHCVLYVLVTGIYIQKPEATYRFVTKIKI